MRVPTLDITDKAISLNSNFEDNDEKERIYWVYDSFSSKNLSLCTRTQVGHITILAMQSVKKSYNCNIMTTFRNRIGDP